MKRRIAIALAMFAPLLFAEEAKKEESKSPEVKDIRIKMVTSQGTIEATLFASKTPRTVANFLNLAKRDYYDGITFHRVISNFMIQGGDPTGTGMGGPGYKFLDETRKDLTHSKAGIFSMANADRGKKAWSNTGKTNGSQFFVTHGATPHLNGLHTVFGETTKGQDVVDKIRKGDTIKDIEVLDSTDALFESQKEQIAEWNKILDAKK